MKRMHALLIALALGIAVVAGTFAALRTTQLGSRSVATHVTSAQIARQNRALSKAEAALRAEFRRKPPAVAALPATRVTAPAQTVIYRRPPAIVHVVHRKSGEGGEVERGEARGGLDD